MRGVRGSRGAFHTIRVAALKKNLAEQMQELGITKFYSEGRHGIGHQAIIEKGHVLQGCWC